MRLTIEPTPEFFMAGDVMVRMWQGTADTGEAVVAFVSLVTFAGQAPAAAENLVSIPPPDEAAAMRWADEVMRRAGKQD